MRKEDIVPALLEACPTFAVVLRELEADGDDDLPYVVLGALARHLLEMKRQGREEILREAARFIERMHTEGDSYVKEAATIGALEGIQNVWANSRANPEDFVLYLHEESSRWWNSLNRFWKGEIPSVGADIPGGLTSRESQ